MNPQVAGAADPDKKTQIGTLPCKVLAAVMAPMMISLIPFEANPALMTNLNEALDGRENQKKRTLMATRAGNAFLKFGEYSVLAAEAHRLSATSCIAAGLHIHESSLAEGEVEIGQKVGSPRA